MTLTLDEIRCHLDGLAKPPGSLGRLEELAARLCFIQQTLAPQTKPRRLVLFAGDHGVAAAGVTAWPSEVTGSMVETISTGRAASSVLAAETGTDAVLVNVGTLTQTRGDESAAGNGAQETSGRSATGMRYRDRRVRAGTRNLADEPALTVDEFEQALQVGRDEARRAADDGHRVVAAGEMGIGNTTSAACLAMLLGEIPAEKAVGPGAGSDDRILTRKREVVETAVGRARNIRESDLQAAVAAVAGLEIAAIAGFFSEAHKRGLTIVLDGYITGAAALLAERLSPGAAESMLAAHLSAEPGHALVLERLGLSFHLAWNLRLGEGTGALLLMPLLDAAAAVAGRMATLEELGLKKG